MTFRLGGQNWAVEMSRVRAIVPATPGMPETAVYQSRSIPVLDLRARLGLNAATNTRRGWVLVVESNERPSGLPVDRLSDILTLRERDIRNGSVRRHGRPIRLLNIDELLAL